MYIYIHTCMCVCMCVCVYTYTAREIAGDACGANCSQN